MPSANSSMVAADFNSFSSTQLFALGTPAFGSDGTRFLYVELATGCSAYKAVCIGAGFTATGADATNMVGGADLGWVQTSGAAGQFGWAAVKGRVGVLVRSSVTLDNAQPFFFNGSTGTTGVLSQVIGTASGSISSVFLVSGTATAGVTVMGAVLVWPRGVAAYYY